MPDPRMRADSPVQFDNIVLNPGAHSLVFDIIIRRLVETHKALYAAMATTWGSTGGSAVATITYVNNTTTGDMDIHVSIA